MTSLYLAIVMSLIVYPVADKSWRATAPEPAKAICYRVTDREPGRLVAKVYLNSREVTSLRQRSRSTACGGGLSVRENDQILVTGLSYKPEIWLEQ